MHKHFTSSEIVGTKATTLILQDATAEDANAADDDLYMVNERLKAALDGTRQELFDVYQRVRPLMPVRLKPACPLYQRLASCFIELQ